MKAGRYFLGDPCYVITSEKWREVCDKSSKSDIFEISNIELFMSGTKYGDGSYEDNFGNEYGVDSGTLGCIPLQLCQRKDLVFSDVYDVPQIVKNSNGYTVGYVFNFEYDFECIAYNGKFDFGGKVKIDTAEDD